MKKILFSAAFLAVTVFCMSCGSDTSAVAQPQAVPKVAEAPKRVEATPTAVYMSSYAEEKTLNGECDGADCISSSFTITFGGTPDQTVTMTEGDRLEKYKESLAVNTNRLKALYKELKTKKAEDFLIAKVNNEITEVWLKEVKKDGKDGAVGEIVPKRPIWSKKD